MFSDDADGKTTEEELLEQIARKKELIDCFIMLRLLPHDHFTRMLSKHFLDLLTKPRLNSIELFRGVGFLYFYDESRWQIVAQAFNLLGVKTLNISDSYLISPDFPRRAINYNAFCEMLKMTSVTQLFVSETFDEKFLPEIEEILKLNLKKSFINGLVRTDSIAKLGYFAPASKAVNAICYRQIINNHPNKVLVLEAKP